jgi:hypothetical protein
VPLDSDEPEADLFLPDPEREVTRS